MDENTGSNQASALTSRQIQGLFEAEISFGDEVDLHRHLADCKKNPGHEAFIPPGKFTVDHLPYQYRQKDIVNFIRALSDITVLITAKKTSNKRPNVCPDSGKPYPFSIIKGSKSKIMRRGSGWVSRVSVFSKRGYNNKTCPCRECRHRNIPKKQWAVIDIYTATHLIFDEMEGEHAECCFFFDNGSNPNGMPSVFGATRIENDLGGDKCTMTYVTHDIALANKLTEKWKLYKSLHKTVGEKYNAIENDNQARSDNNQKLVIIVSHPHGCSKQITVGYFKERQEMEYNDVFTRYTYTTPTCPGSSGAPVYVLSRWWWWGCDHPHSGQCEDNKELNYSGLAMY